jgi:DHA1 family multidrug resistance protein-like MFS transporter
MCGLAITVFSMTVFTGPLLAPFIGGFIVDSYLGWRWTEYLPGIMGAVAFLLDFLIIEETYPPVVLIAKAAELRRRTKNWGIHAKQEEIEVDFASCCRRTSADHFESSSPNPSSSFSASTWLSSTDSSTCS